MYNSQRCIVDKSGYQNDESKDMHCVENWTQETQFQNEIILKDDDTFYC